MRVQVNKFGVYSSAGLCKQFRIVYKTCCSVNCGFQVNANKYDLMLRAGTFRVRSVFVNLKFSILIYVKNCKHGVAITVVVLYLPLICSALVLCMGEESVINPYPVNVENRVS
jgi:hypothetical protein